MAEFAYERIFINKSMKITDNFHKTAILIKSPIDQTMGIWFPKKFISKSDYPRYFGVTIKKQAFYKIYRYKNFDVCEVKEIRGEQLIKEYQALKNRNSTTFLAKAEEEPKSKRHKLFNPEDEDLIMWD